MLCRSAGFGQRLRQNVGRDLVAAGGFGGHGHCAALWVACCRTLDCQSLAASDGGCCGAHSDLRIGTDSHIAAVARAFLQDAPTGDAMTGGCVQSLSADALVTDLGSRVAAVFAATISDGTGALVGLT